MSEFEKVLKREVAKNVMLTLVCERLVAMGGSLTFTDQQFKGAMRDIYNNNAMRYVAPLFESGVITLYFDVANPVEES
jgi:hypothetical protein